MGEVRLRRKQVGEKMRLKGCAEWHRRQKADVRFRWRGCDLDGQLDSIEEAMISSPMLHFLKTFLGGLA